MASYFEFKYYDGHDLVPVDGIINIGDVSQGAEGSVQFVHLFARNISKHYIFNPGLYITLQDQESRAITSKPDNIRELKSPKGERDSFVSVSFTTIDTDTWESVVPTSQYFTNYYGTKNNPIHFPNKSGGVSLINGRYCVEPGREVDFWLRIKNTQTSGAVTKDMEDGKIGFAIKVTGDLYGW